MPDGEYAQAMTHVVGIEIACSCQREKSQLTNKIDFRLNSQHFFLGVGSQNGKWDLPSQSFTEKIRFGSLGLGITNTGRLGFGEQ